ncbi:hypothetical protein D0469_01270 [Peribacillus saganii]|uniref:Uncharacterized protein n=1 Tax=Peribacillus saganii TaxID=2303992 RepID=A0A372LUB0_9BACI|nr:hypothetical protein [Peribacillus saganii]RFU71497.1 hypothetical protein D0469_01270 [Peribacillus saganii]
MRNTIKLHQMESVDVDKDACEIGLVLKAELVANGFPQTNQELKKGKEIKKYNLEGLNLREDIELFFGLPFR